MRLSGCSSIRREACSFVYGLRFHQLSLPFAECGTFPRLPPDSQWVCSHHKDVRFCLLSSAEQLVRSSPRIGVYPAPSSPHLSRHMAAAVTYSIWAQLCHWRIFWPPLFWQPDASFQTQRPLYRIGRLRSPASSRIGNQQPAWQWKLARCSALSRITRGPDWGQATQYRSFWNWVFMFVIAKKQP